MLKQSGRHFSREAFGIFAIGLAFVGASALVAGCGKATPVNTFVSGQYTGTTPPTVPINDQFSCNSYGGSWLAGSVCKFIYTYHIMGGNSGYYWLSGSWLPLVRPGAPTELNNAGQTTYPHNALDTVTFTGDPKYGNVNSGWSGFFSSSDGCNDNTVITMVISDQVQTYTLAPNVQTTLVNSGYIAFGFDKSQQTNWSNKCVEANRNTPIYLKVSHCIQNNVTVACP